MTGHNNFLHHVDRMLNINTTKQPPSNHDPRILIDPPDHSSLKIQAYPSIKGGVPRSKPIGADLACRLLDFRTWLPVTRHSLDSHTSGWSNKPSVSNLSVKNDCKVGPRNYFENMACFFLGRPFAFRAMIGGHGIFPGFLFRIL